MSLFKLYNVRTRTTNPLHCLYLRIRVNVHTYVCMFPICGYTAGHGSVTPSLGAAPWTASSVCRCGSLGFGVLCWDCSSACSLRGAAACGLDCDSKLALAKHSGSGKTHYHKELLMPGKSTSCTLKSQSAQYCIKPLSKHVLLNTLNGVGELRITSPPTSPPGRERLVFPCNRESKDIKRGFIKAQTRLPPGPCSHIQLQTSTHTHTHTHPYTQTEAQTNKSHLPNHAYYKVPYRIKVVKRGYGP